MKQLFQDIHIDSIMTFLRQINFFNKIKSLIYFLSCFIFVLAYNALSIVSLHHYDRLSLYSVQVKNMCSRLE